MDAKGRKKEREKEKEKANLTLYRNYKVKKVQLLLHNLLTNSGEQQEHYPPPYCTVLLALSAIKETSLLNYTRL